MDFDHKFDFDFADAVQSVRTNIAAEEAKKKDKITARSELNQQLSSFLAHNTQTHLLFELEGFTFHLQSGSENKPRSAILEIVDADKYVFTEQSVAPVTLARDGVARALLFFAFNRKSS